MAYEGIEFEIKFMYISTLSLRKKFIQQTFSILDYQTVQKIIIFLNYMKTVN